MSINISSETTITIAEAAKMLPPGRNGRPVHFSAVLRWILQGTKGLDGRRVHLEAVRLGGRWITSHEALQRFADALTPRLDDDAAPRSRTVGQRAKAAERAAAELAAMGV